MNQLHPIFAQALAPFTGLPAYTAPACPKGMFEFVASKLLSCDLVCHLEYEEAEPATQDEPGFPESIWLCAAYVRGVNIYDLIDNAQIEEIEAAALADLNKRAEEYADESAYEADISLREYLEA